MLLSIVICNYNYGRFLDSAIASAVGQTYANTEVIVIDDGSTDDSAEVIGRWGDKVRAIFQPNGGQLAAYNRGFLEARGDAIVFLDSDDTLDLNVGAKIVEAFRDDDVAKVHFRLRLIDADGRLLGPSIPRRLSDGQVSHYLRRGMLYDSSPGSGNAYRKTALVPLMPLPVAPEDPHAADFFIIMGTAFLGTVRVVGPEALGGYRVHGEHAGEQLLFGNARVKEQNTAQKRYSRMRAWLIERLGSAYTLPEQMIDFSMQKLVFANIVFGTDDYADGLRRGSSYFASTLARSIYQRSSSIAEKVGLMGWGLAVLVLPRDLGRPIARYVCNPASRGPLSPSKGATSA